jgi:hypothetical protein
MSLTNRFVKTLHICVTFFALAPNLAQAEASWTVFKGYQRSAVTKKNPKFILDNATIKKSLEHKKTC